MNDRHTGWRRRAAVYFFTLLAFASGVLIERAGWFTGTGSPRATFREAWRLVEQEYVDEQAVRADRMTDGAIRGMLASLGDVGHTSYLTRAEFAEVSQGLKGEFEGIGARLTV